MAGPTPAPPPDSSPTIKEPMMRSILLWVLGVPIPIIILIALFMH
ncbi:MAG: hypothetical protein ABI624_01295 [Casimicrobiaceae bacterium]